MRPQFEESICDILSRLARLTAGLILVIGTYIGAESPVSSENSEVIVDEPLHQAGPTENPGSVVPPRGYQSRPCGFDLNHNGVVGEPDDCNVCDASLVGDKVVANTTDPDGDGIDEDLIYVDCENGSNFNYCGRPGFRPCATIEYAWDTIADGPEDGAEDIVCFTGTCTPNDFIFPPEFRGVPGYWTKAKEGSETRDWQFPKDPAMLVGWDLDNDGKYPPHDQDDIAELDGSDSKWAFAVNRYNGGNSFYELAHFQVRDYGVHNSTGDGGGFLDMFATSQAVSHGHIHDLSLNNINRGAGLWSGNITFSWFKSHNATHIALTNIESLNEGGYTFRGAADVKGDTTAGPWRFQNLSVTARGCNLGPCNSVRAQKMILKLWGWVDGIEILDSQFDTKARAWSPHRVNGIDVSAFTRDWDIVNNELVDWDSAIVGQAEIPDSYGGTPRYTDNIVIRGNLLINEFRDENIFVNLHDSGENNEALKDVWILNNVMYSTLRPQAFIRIRQGNTEGPSVTNVRVDNNTLFGKASAAIRIDNPPDAIGRFKRLKLRNNIIKGIDPDDRNVQSDYDLEYLDSDFNVFDADAWFKLGESEVHSILDWRSLSGMDSHSVACSPAFRSVPFDLRLAGSDTCAVDRGNSLTYLTSSDIEGDSRPYGASWDIGADEWNGGFFWDSLETGDLSHWSAHVQ